MNGIVLSTGYGKSMNTLEASVATNPLRLVLTLSIAGFISGLAIVGMYELTLPPITAYRAQELREAVFKVLPGIVHMQQLAEPEDSPLAPAEDYKKKDQPAVYAGYDREGVFMGYAIPAEGAGFQDTIRLLYGYRPDRQRIVGMEVLESRETPGLGDKIYKDAAFRANFQQLAILPAIELVKKGHKVAPYQVDAITGATISSQAVVRIIQTSLKETLVKLPPSGSEPPLRQNIGGGNAVPAKVQAGMPLQTKSGDLNPEARRQFSSAPEMDSRDSGVPSPTHRWSVQSW